MQENSIRALRRQLMALQDACRDANTAARNALGLAPLDEPSDNDPGAHPFNAAHSSQLGSLVDLMSSKLKAGLKATSFFP